MIGLQQYRKYWEYIAERTGCTGVLPVTIDNEMSKKIQRLERDSLTLFVFPPLAEAKTAVNDAFREQCQCVVFVMKKYDPQRQTAFEVLEQTQPTVEDVKILLVDHQHFDDRAPFRVDVSTIETAPETELYGTFAGWSIGFTAESR